MVAIGTGMGVGLERSSASLIGPRGQIGSASTGRGGDNAFVNAATGNLVITRQDEFLVGLGPDVAISRTYNSQSSVGDGDNNDQWRMSPYRQIIGANGAATVTRVDWDGSETVYFQYAANSYATLDGAGAHDWMNWTGTQWNWTDASSQLRETYDATGKLISTRDTDGNTLNYSYSGNLLSSISDPNGERTDFLYGGTGGTQLQRITTVSGSSSVRVRYGYDGSGRLWTVTVDLSPGDASIADGQTYVTTYGYDGASKRVASITQTDGSLLEIGYAYSGTDYRVVSLTETVAAGITRVTGLFYDVTNRVTRITDPAGGLTTMSYDPKGNLTQVVMPAPRPGAAASTTAYTYTPNGDLLSMTEDGRRTDYEYDAAGNLKLSRDAAGNTIVRSYDARSQMVTSTLYLGPDLDGANPGVPTAPVTTRYVYDAALESHLRFAISAEGDVIEYQYNAAGQLLSTIAYTAQKFDVSLLASDVAPAESTMMSWAAAIADKSSVRRTDTTYDVRGNVKTVTRFSAANAAGTGLTSADHSVDTYIYSPFGQLLSRINSNSSAEELFVYDGLGRLTATTDMAGASTGFAFTDTASNITTTATLASGLTRIAAYNKAGELISVTESGANVSTALTQYFYDGLGRLRMETNPNGSIYHVYDNASRKLADITTDGSMTEYSYDASGRLVKTIGYINKLTGDQITQLAGASSGGVGGSGTGAQGISGAPTGSNLLNNGSFETSGAGAVSTGTGWSNTTLPSWTKINSQTYEQVQSATGGVNATDGTYWLDLDSIAGAGWVTVGSERLVNGSFETAASDQEMTGWVKVNPEGYQRLPSGTGGIAATNGSYWLDLDSTRQTGTVTVGGNLVNNGSFETAGATDQSMPGWTKINAQPFQQLASGTGGVAATNGTYWLDLDSKYQSGWAGTGSNWLVNGSFEQMGSSDQQMPGWTKTNSEYFQQFTSGAEGVVATDGNRWLDLDSAIRTGYSTIGGNVASNGSFESSGGSYATTSNGRLGATLTSWTSNNNALLEQVTSGVMGVTATAGSYWLDLDAPTRVAVGNNLLTNGSFEQVTGNTAAISGGRSAATIPGWTKSITSSFEMMTSGTGGVTATDGSYWLDLDVAKGVPQGQDILVNGSFEQVNGTGTPTANGTLYTSMPGWTISNSQGVERVPSGTFGMAAADGTYFLDMDGQTGAASNADISQTVALTASQQFTISLSYANTAGMVEGVEGPESSGALWVYWNGNVVGSIGSDEAAFGTKTFTVTGVVGNNTLRLREMGSQDGRGVSLDNVKLIAGATQSAANLKLSQTVTGLTAGQIMQLSFDHANRGAVGTGSFYVTWNGLVVGTYDDATATMQTTTMFVTAAAGNNVLEFGGMGTADNIGASLDNVRLFATQAAAPTNVDIQQKIYVGSAGLEYRIQFDYANRTTAASGSFDVLWNGTVVASVTDGVAAMQTKTLFVTSVAGYNLLGFRGTGTADDAGASLDNIRATWVIPTYTPGNMDVSQAVTGLTAGQKMELSFDHANRTTSASGSFDVLWNGQVIDSISSTGTTMQRKTYYVTAVGGTDVVEFRGTGTANDVGASIDNVSLLTAQPVYSTGNMDVRQTVPNLAAGQAMQLKFDYANRTGAPSGSFEVLWNGVVIDTVTDGTVAMKPRTYAVTAVAGDNVIGFRGIGTVDDVGASIDNVQLYATQPVMTHGNMDIRQTVSGLAAGKMQLQFDHANRTTAASGSFDVYWNGNKIASINSTGTTMLTKTYQVDALAGDNILRFVGTGTVDDNGASIDNVRLLAMVYDIGGGNMDISQSVTVGTAGPMHLMFDHANRTSAASGSFDVYWNGNPIASINSTGTTMLTKSYQVTAVAGTNTVRFVGTGTVDALGASIDNVRLFETQTVPGGGGIVTDALAGLRPQTHGDDRYSWNIYDSASRLIETIDGSGSVTVLTYDGASRLIETRAYAGQLATATVNNFKTLTPTALVTPGPDALNDRATRNFYRKDGLLAGALDGEGYLTENVYDGQGLLIETIGYATATVGNRATGSFEDLKAGVVVPVNGKDIHNWYVYDGRGLLRGEINGEGDLARYHYTAAGFVDQKVRGQKLSPAALIASRPTFASLPTAAGGQIVETTNYTRDAAGKVLSEVRLLADGTSWTTAYGYDSAGRLTSRTEAAATGDARTVTHRYDARGNLIGELGGEGSAALAALGLNPAAAAVDNVYATWGTIYRYDAGNRLVSKTESNGENALGNRTVYYYRGEFLAFEMNALGEVIEYRYNARGERTDTIAYANRVAAATVAGVWGGEVHSGVQSVVDSLVSPGFDSISHIDYNVTGTVKQSIDPLNNSVTYGYNAFRELKTRTDPIDASTSVQTDRLYDRRGLLLSEKRDAAAGGLMLETLYGYDAFGRPSQVTDPAGRVRKTDYDRAGRLALATDARNVSHSFGYDGRGNVITLTDRNQATTTFTYEPFSRKMTTKTPGLITTEITRNAHGQTVTIKDGALRETVYGYDKDGNLETETDAVSLVRHFHDEAGRREETIDARGSKTRYAYDPANRVLTETVDHGGLNLLTQYKYDAKGQNVEITDPEDRVTRIDFDNAGRKVAVIVDSTGLALRTEYEYDKSGRLITVTEADETAVARVTKHEYDKADRLLRTRVDPAGLNLLTQYSYDKAGNVARRTDAANFVTTYAYDAENRLTRTLDPEGGVVETFYDDEGRVAGLRRYFNTGSAATAPNGAFTISVAADNLRDQVSAFYYDVDGRLKVSVDGVGRPTERFYDNAGNVVRSIDYAGAITYLIGDSLTIIQGRAAALPTPANHRITRAVYDGANRQAYSIDATGQVTALGYDAGGNIIKRTRYFNLFTATNDPSFAEMGTWATNNANPAEDRIDRTFYDGASRATFSVDAENYVTRDTYDDAGRVTARIRYVSKNYSTGDGVTEANLAGQVAAAQSTAAVTGFAYDTAGRLTETTDAENVVTRRVLDQLGQATHVIVADNVPADSSTTYREFDKAGRVKKETRALGTLEASTTRYTYDGMGRMRTAIDPYDVTTEYIYDPMGRCIQEIQPLNAGQIANTFKKYDRFGNLVKLTDPRTKSAYFHYDALNRLVWQTDPEGYVTKTTYSRGDEVASVTRYAVAVSGTTETTPPAVAPNPAIDSTTVFERDKLDRVKSVTDAELKTEVYTLNAFGDRISVKNKIDGTTHNVFDKRGLLLTETLPVGSTRADGSLAAANIVNKYDYDARGNRITTTEAYGIVGEERITNFEYYKTDLLKRKIGQQVSVLSSPTAAAASTTPTEDYKYDARGNLVETLASWGARSLSYYDDHDRKIAEIQATSATHGTLSKWDHDLNGNVKAARIYAEAFPLPVGVGGTAPDSTSAYRQTLYDYDANNRRIRSKVVGLRSGEYGSAYLEDDIILETVYDLAGNVVQEKDGRNQSKFFYYDNAGRKIAQVDQLLYLTFYTLDGEGNVTKEERFANQVALPTITSLPLALRATVVGGVGDRVTNFEYDRNGRRTSETRVGVNGNKLSASGQLEAAHSVDARIAYDYNGLGQVVRKTEANLDFTEFEYDLIGRQTAVQSASYIDFQTNSARRRTETTYNGLGDVTRSVAKSRLGTADRVTSYTYGAGGRLEHMKDAADFVRTYSYDAAGNVVLESYSRADSAGIGTAEANGYRYDLLNRVTSQSMLTKPASSWIEGVVTRIRYNSFGEISGRGLNADANGTAYQETFDYDAGGRMWRSTSGDGTVRLYGHDKAGNANLVIASAGDNLSTLSLADAISAYVGGGSGVATTATEFDGRGQATATHELQRQLANGVAGGLITTRRFYNAFGEVRQEVDAFTRVTDYSYNTAGKVTKRELPTASYTPETGPEITGTRAAENYFYDLSGRQIGVEDAYGDETTRLLLAGTGYGDDEATVLAEYHPDDGVARKAVDEFGDVRTSTDEISRVTGYTYDKMGRLTELAHNGGLIDSYRYDGLGQRTQHWNSFYGNGYVDRTDYDSQGRVRRFIQASQLETTVSTTYVWNPNAFTNGLGTFGGWEKTTRHGDPTVTRQASETTDYFGRVIGKTDFGDRTYTFTYDNAGRLSQQTSSANQNLTFTYFNTGKTAKVIDSYTSSVSSPSSIESTFAYDVAGNRVFESYVKTSYAYTYGSGYSSSSTQQSLQSATVTYDELGRMKKFEDTGASGSNPAKVEWEYDRVGNIRKIKSTYTPIVADANGNTLPYTTERWFTYDTMNRMVWVNGTKRDGLIRSDQTIGSGMAAYNEAGEREYFITEFVEFGITGGVFVAGYGQIREDYKYTPAGYLEEVKQTTANWDFNTNQLGAFTMPRVLANDTRDALGRMIVHEELGNFGTSVVHSRIATYNVLSQVVTESTTTLQHDTSWLTSNRTYDYKAESAPMSGSWSGDYQGGVVTHIHTVSSNGYGPEQTADLRNSYVWWNEAQIAVASNQVSPTETHTSTYTYDENGKLASVNIQDGRPRTVNYVTDLNGQVMSRTEYSPATKNPINLYYYFDGIRIGEVGNNGPSQTDYATAISRRSAAPQTGPFKTQLGSPMSAADFDQAFTPISPDSEPNTASIYTVREGDSLRTIAHVVWGDPDMWYLIGEANGLGGTSALVAGQKLRIPAKVTNIHNNAQTFRVYDPNKAIGNTSPSEAAQPKPAQGRGGCGMLGTIILIAIAVAVTLILKVPVTGLISQALANTALAGAAGVIGAATTGAIASVVSQGFGVATGIQDKFSWKGVAMSALSAGITQGVGGGPLINGAGKVVNDVARGALINAATQGVAVATGLQKKFDWAGVAVAAVVSGVTGALSRALPGAARAARMQTDLAPEIKAQAASQINRFASSLGGAIAGAGVRSAVTGTSFGDNLLAVLPDVIGATIGNMIGDALNGASTAKSRGSSAGGPAESDDYLGDGRVGASENPADEGFFYEGDGRIDAGEVGDYVSLPDGRHLKVGHESGPPPSAVDMDAIRRLIHNVPAASAAGGGLPPGVIPTDGGLIHFAPGGGGTYGNVLLNALAGGYADQLIDRHDNPIYGVSSGAAASAFQISQEMSAIGVGKLYDLLAVQTVRPEAVGRVTAFLDELFVRSEFEIPVAPPPEQPQQGFIQGFLSDMGEAFGPTLSAIGDLGRQFYMTNVFAFNPWRMQNPSFRAEYLRLSQVNGQRLWNGAQSAYGAVSDFAVMTNPVMALTGSHYTGAVNRTGDRVIGLVKGTVHTAGILATGLAELHDATLLYPDAAQQGRAVSKIVRGTAGLALMRGGGAATASLRGATLTEVYAVESAFGAARQGLRIPQGLTARAFDRISAKIRAEAGRMGLGDDIFVMGSRSGGTARTGADLDIGIRVSPERFDELISQNFAGARNSRAATRDISIRDGRIQAGEAKLRSLTKSIARDLGVDRHKVQISVIRARGPFDNGPQSTLSFGF
jgi:YD repeat-containing protein